MRCPRCHGEQDAGASSCAACGAPLLLVDEPAPAPLDRAVDLDRRTRGRLLPEAPPVAPTAGAAPWEHPTPVWDLGSEPDPGAGEPGGAAWSAGPALVPTPARGSSGAAAFTLTPLPWTAGALALGDEPGWPGSGDEAGPAPDADGDPVPAPLELEPVEPWRRVAAAVVDLLVLGAAAAPPILLAARALPASRDAVAVLWPACAGLVAALAFTYAVLGHALMGATLGKRALGVRVVGPHGERPGPGRCAIRAAVAVAGSAALGVGVLVALLAPRGRGLHDLAAGTAVARAP